MEDDLRRRSAEDILEDHLRLAEEHRFEEDIERKVAPHCVILELRGIFHGRNRLRACETASIRIRHAVRCAGIIHPWTRPFADTPAST